MHADGSDHRERGLMRLALVMALVMFVLPLAFACPLLDPDEGLHASIAQEMVERGDWVTPRICGVPFCDKPILYFWFQAGSLAFFGFNEVAIRLPGLMFGLLGAVTTGLLAWRLFDRPTGWIAGILYATTILPTAMAQAASHDVALIPWINLSLLLLWESDQAVLRRTAVACVLGAGAFAGLAVLTKGLFGLAVIGVVYGGYLVVTRRLRLRHVLHGAAVVGVAVLLASPWYYLIESRVPGYLQYYLLDRHVLGFATDSQRHGDQAWWYYVPILLGGGLPWIGYLPIVVQDGMARRGAKASFLPAPGAMPFLWFWLLGWTLLMTVAGSKLATYVWPVFPAMAVLAATAWVRRIDGILSAAAVRTFARTFVCSSWSGPIVLPAVLLVVQAGFAVHFAWPVWAGAAMVAAGTVLPLIPWRAGRWQASLTAAALSLAVQFLFIVVVVLPVVAETFSARRLAEHFNRQGQVPARVFMAEERIGSLVFYLTPELRRSLAVEQLQPFVVREPAELRSGDVMAVPERRFSHVCKVVDLEGLPYESVGHYRLYTIR